jgi:hypothetical protein
MLVFHTDCQMGNTMFIYASARSLAKRRNLTYCLNNIKALEYFELSKQDKYFNSFKYFLFRIKNKIKPNSYSYFHFQDNSLDHSEVLSKELSKNVWYYGYFQGEKYFFENDAELKTLLKIKSVHQTKFNSIINKFSKEKKTVVVHIRLRDYKTFGPDYLNGPDMTLPFSYYKNLLNKYETHEYQIIFTSDDIETIKKEFKNIKDAYFSENDAIIDFQFIKNADIAIISHSTFAWWAAWLNEKPNKQIFVPKYFLGFKVEREYPVNIIPESWSKVHVPNNNY